MHVVNATKITLHCAFELRNFKGFSTCIESIYQECAHDWKCCSVGEIEMGRGAVNLHKTKKVMER